MSECHQLIANQKSNVDEEGGGAYGKVISCKIETESNNTVRIAVKIVNLSDSILLELEDHRTIINNELIALDNINRLDSIWLPLYYGCIYDNEEEIVYIFMEHLDAIITEGLKKDVYDRMEPKDRQVKALQVMLQTARGVEGLHSLGLAHNDIRNFNIMLDERSGVTKLIDFGRVCMADQDRYDKAVKPEKRKNGYIKNVNPNKLAPPTACRLSNDIKDLKFIFRLIMEIVLDIPLSSSDISSMDRDNEQFEESILSLFEEDQKNTITDIIPKLEQMLKGRADSELLDVETLSNDYRLKNLDKFKLNVFSAETRIQIR